MRQQFTQVDAFTDRPFAGNPAAVYILSAPRDDAWMQNVAREMNLSETAFLVRRTPPEEGFDLRWFTPAVEVDLCGHATLASAHVLWEEGHLAPTEAARFHTRSGVLTAERRVSLAAETQSTPTANDETSQFPDGGTRQFPRGEREHSHTPELRGSLAAEQRDCWIELDFPSKPVVHAADSTEPAATLAELARALGTVPRYVGRNDFDYLVEVGSEAEVRDLAPDFTRLRTIPVRGIIVTAAADDPPFDFVSRFFAPRAGVDEDPVTGSAHCCLAPFWADRFGKTELLARQLSPRGGTVRVRTAGERVILGGQAVTVLTGHLLV